MASELSFCKFYKITLGSERTHLNSLEADSEMELDMQDLYCDQHRNGGEESRLGQRERWSNQAGLTKPQPTIQRGRRPIRVVSCWAQGQGLLAPLISVFGCGPMREGRPLGQQLSTADGDPDGIWGTWGTWSFLEGGSG